MSIFKKLSFFIIFPIIIKSSYFNDINLLNPQISNSLFQKQSKNSMKDLIQMLYSFIKNHTNIEIQDPDIFDCTNTLTDSLDFRLLYVFSGKGVSEPGLESDCIQYNFSYYFITYIYKEFSLQTFIDDFDVYQFINQTSFYTGICIPKYCNNIIKKLLNKTSNEKFFDYLFTDWRIEKLDYFLQENSTNIFINKDNTFDFKSNYEYFYGIIFCILLILIFQILFYILFICCYSLSKTEKNKISNESEYEDIDEMENSVFTNNTPLIGKKEEEKKSCELFLYYFNIVSTFKTLLKKKNKIYDETNLEFISFLKVCVMILLTFIQNMLILIKIPARDFFNEKFYKDKLFFFIKFSSFSLDFYISLEGFVMMFKLLSYIKKNVYNKNKSTVDFSIYFNFFCYSLYKIFPFIILFFLFTYFDRNLIYYFSSGSLVNHYIVNVFNQNYFNKIFHIFIPGITLYLPYKDNKYIDSFYSYYTYPLLYLNEFYIFCISLILIFIGFKLKSKIYDIIIFIGICINVTLTILINENKENEYYNFEKIINGMYNIKYPHLMLNNYFIGIFTGVICFSFKDFISSNSVIQTENQYIPFQFLFEIFRCFGLISDKMKKILIAFTIILQILFSSFLYFLILNYDSLLIRFDLFEKIIYYYDKPIQVMLFNFIIICVYAIDYDMSKGNNIFNFFIFFSRNDFSFVCSISTIIYALYCMYFFQLKLSYQNLCFISLGLFMNILLFNIILTITIVFPFKLIFKKLLKSK